MSDIETTFVNGSVTVLPCDGIPYEHLSIQNEGEEVSKKTLNECVPLNAEEIHILTHIQPVKEKKETEYGKENTIKPVTFVWPDTGAVLSTMVSSSADDFGESTKISTIPNKKKNVCSDTITNHTNTSEIHQIDEENKALIASETNFSILREQSTLDTKKTGAASNESIECSDQRTHAQLLYEKPRNDKSDLAGKKADNIGTNLSQQEKLSNILPDEKIGEFLENNPISLDKSKSENSMSLAKSASSKLQDTRTSANNEAVGMIPSSNSEKSDCENQKLKSKRNDVLAPFQEENANPASRIDLRKEENTGKTMSLHFLKKQFMKKKKEKVIREILQDVSPKENKIVNPRILLVSKNEITQLTEKSEGKMPLAPGTYHMSEIIGVTADRPREPNHAELRIDRTAWKSAVKSENESGRIEVPEEALSTKIPVEKATFDLLQFYGCQLISTHSKTQLSFSYEHEINDFHYANAEHQVSGLEKRKAVHIICSLSPAKESGCFLVGKWLKRQGTDEGFLCMTAFRVPEYHAVYVPEETIYSNDFLRGTWRVISPKAAQGHIDHVRVCATKSESNNKEKYQSDRHFLIEKEVPVSVDVSSSGKDDRIIEQMICCYDTFLPNFDFGKMKNGGQSFLPNSDFENKENDGGQ